ncbi:MAG: hypothetical protein WBQ25_04985 [Nitrososphaeraceae archaeon]
MHTLKIRKTFLLLVVERVKNPSQLLEYEKFLVDLIILRLGAFYTALRAKYPTPKKLAKFFISIAKSKKRMAALYLVLKARSAEAKQGFAPINLNEELANTMHYTMDKTNITVKSEEPAIFINSADMTKNLKTLQFAGIYENIIGKKEIKQYRKARSGRPKRSDKKNNESGGYPSIYKTTEGIERLKKVILEPEAYNRVRNVLKESKLIYEYEKFVFQALYYVAIEDKVIAGQILRLILSDDVIKKFDKFLDKFASIDENDLEKTADEGVRIAMDNQRYEDFMFGGALFPIAC